MSDIIENGTGQTTTSTLTRENSDHSSILPFLLFARKPAGYKIEFIIRIWITAYRNIDKRFYKQYDLVIRIFALICFQIYAFAFDFDVKTYISYGHPTLHIRHT